MAEFLTLSQVAEELALSYDVVYGLVRSAELPAIKVGGSGQWLVERRTVDEWIERHRD